MKSLKPALKLSLPALETLAVIAYKQPVTAPEVNEIRGVDSSAVFGSLLARKLITTAGRKQVIGRPILYKTTREFLLRFGLKDVTELPSMEEFEKMAASELEEPELMATGMRAPANGAARSSIPETDGPGSGRGREQIEPEKSRTRTTRRLPATGNSRSRVPGAPARLSRQKTEAFPMSDKKQTKSAAPKRKRVSKTTKRRTAPAKKPREPKAVKATKAAKSEAAVREKQNENDRREKPKEQRPRKVAAPAARRSPKTTRTIDQGERARRKDENAQGGRAGIRDRGAG